MESFATSALDILLNILGYGVLFLPILMIFFSSLEKALKVFSTSSATTTLVASLVCLSYSVVFMQHYDTKALELLSVASVYINFNYVFVCFAQDKQKNFRKALSVISVTAAFVVFIVIALVAKVKITFPWVLCFGIIGIGCIVFTHLVQLFELQAEISIDDRPLSVILSLVPNILIALWKCIDAFRWHKEDFWILIFSIIHLIGCSLEVGAAIWLWGKRMFQKYRSLENKPETRHGSDGSEIKGAKQQGINRVLLYFLEELTQHTDITTTIGERLNGSFRKILVDGSKVQQSLKDTLPEGDGRKGQPKEPTELFGRGASQLNENSTELA